ncbi:alpha/beta fold hydrolase [Streptomyces flavofungini]|uniref:alpha/beta fold hydrolase n=1 Tax=Streptomyces flavofungini TaxID=68200 RepID=UPI0025B01DA9|nr:alpha/beta fold hydrolase [Streptomyces flavofungini]WJV51692.1 alpha/beta fold hydrolase [Streptomyces flavofungini]
MGISERLAALTSLSSALEYLHERQHIEPGGLNDWDIMQETPESHNVVLRKLAHTVSGRKTTLAIHTARAAVSLAMLAPGKSRWRGAGSLFLAASSSVLQARHRYGTDGSDQVAMLTQTATGLARLSRDSRTQDALLWYVSMQAGLSYAVSGWVKLVGDKWRSGAALPGVMRTRTYGWEPAFRLTQKYPRAAKVLQHSVLAMECGFPIVYLARGRLARPVLASVLGFHTANAFVMGLGRFLTSFESMHPMVAYTTTPKTHPAAAGRDDRAVKAAGLLLAAGAAASIALAAQRRAVVLEGHRTSRTITTRHGNVLQFETGGQDDADTPVLVFCAGLASTSEHFAWITERFAYGSDYAVVAYARAGYAGSRRRTPAPYTLTESVDDLEDLIGQVVPAHRKVVLVGHSLGGELIRRVSSRIADRVAGMVYLDPSHPAELQRSKRQSDGAKDLRDTLIHASRYLKLGTGVVMSRTEWLDKLPARYRHRVFAQYTDARLWNAARREWAAAEKEFRSFGGDIDPLPFPGLLIAAQQTVDQDPDHLLLYHELTQAHEGPNQGGLQVIEGADHDSVLTDARFAHQAAQLMADFLKQALEGGGKDIKAAVKGAAK